jgi:hypothetical protein
MHKFFLALILLSVPASTGALAESGTDQEKACAPDVQRFCCKLTDQGDLTILACLMENRSNLLPNAVTCLSTTGNSDRSKRDPCLNPSAKAATPGTSYLPVSTVLRELLTASNRPGCFPFEGERPSQRPSPSRDSQGNGEDGRCHDTEQVYFSLLQSIGGTLNLRVFFGAGHTPRDSRERRLNISRAS